MTRETCPEWIHLDPSAGILSQLCLEMGVKDVQVDQVLSVDRLYDQKSVYGVIVFLHQNIPIVGNGGSSSSKKCADSSMKEESNDRIYFANQVVNNAYSMHALLSILLNCEKIDIGSTLMEYKIFTKDFPSMLKGLSLSNSQALRNSHNLVGRAWPEQSNQKPVYHYVSYLPFGGYLWELDGFKKAPLRLGQCTEKNWLEIAQSKLSQKIGRYQENDWSMYVVVENQRKVHQRNLATKLAFKTRIETQLNQDYPEWKTSTDVQHWEEEYQHAMMNDEHNRRGMEVSAHWTTIPSTAVELTPPILPRNLKDAIDLWLQVKDDILQLYTELGKEEEKQDAYQGDAIRRQHDYGPFVNAYLEAMQAQGILSRPEPKH
ncbi:ubiquitin carboxyl-terminal hydrolase [Absidia repens]|uniref:ubiquitinyl hydrolase 1 n=1 Tax=Absidia repens TaxID=90262 RepID=A0A1X2I2V6_9FUNG|nr:ubiquitin carboxyl-terminal hydrolase [Absidia repens]